MSERPGRYQRTFSGLIGALLVLLLVVGAFVAFRDLNRNDPASPVRAVEVAGPAAAAQERADFELLSPERLPDGWIATSVRFGVAEEDSGSSSAVPGWHVGMLTEERRYVGLEQARRPVEEMVAEFVDEDAVRGEDVRLRGRVWQGWSDARGDRALVNEDDGVTTLVVGTVPRSTLAALVTTLR